MAGPGGGAGDGPLIKMEDESGWKVGRARSWQGWWGNPFWGIPWGPRAQILVSESSCKMGVLIAHTPPLQSYCEEKTS